MFDPKTYTFTRKQLFDFLCNWAGACFDHTGEEALVKVLRDAADRGEVRIDDNWSDAPFRDPLGDC